MPNSPSVLSYRQILQASALIGGSSALVVVVGVIRTKIVALLLGPVGIGLMGIYASVLDLALSVIGMGIGRSGVRQVAEASSSGDTNRIARTIAVLRRLSLLLGIAGAVLLIALSRPISLASFGTEDHAVGIAVLSAAIFLQLVSIGQGALLQGMRRLHDMAHANVATAILGTLATIALVYFMGERGVVLSIVAGTAIGLALSWWYVRRIRSPRVRLSRSDVTQEAGNLLKLGFAFMLSGVLMMGAGYAVRSLIVHFDSLHSAGLYQAAWAIGGMYVAFILQAMGTDFYPRLVSVIASHTDCNQVVNEQAHVSLLLAGPGVVGTILLAPWIATLLYSEEFAQASELLRWLCLGTALRVVTWPMGYIIVAANNRRFFVGTELAWALVNVGLTWWLVQLYGLSGAGVAFFLSYVFHGTLVYPVVRRMTGFRWSRENLRTGVIFLASTSVAFVSCHVLPPLSAAVVGTLTLLFSVFFSLRSIWQLTSMHIVPNRIRRLIAWVHKLGTWRR